jgi:wyosine [tRNA(Phe)-imidazoG37] synthetase (radical SAM superfamily)
VPIARHSIFARHDRAWRDNLYVYPVISRRSKGLSIGINLNPDKACNFDCVYCCADRSRPPTVRGVDLEIVAAELDHMLHLATGGGIYEQQPFDQAPRALRRLNDVAFSGDGEPTSYPRFGDACRLVADALAQRRLSDVKVVVITNATLLHRPGIVDALAFLDGRNGEIWAKLEAGTDAYYQRVERTNIPLQRVIDNIADAGRARPIVIQSLFMRLHGEPTPLSEIDAYIERLGELLGRGCQIKLVQVYTTARATHEPFVSPLEEPMLQRITDRVRTLGLAAECFPAPS